MMRRSDPLADVESLLRDVYAYVAYRVPNRSDAEEITSAVFERAVRYRKSYDTSKGSPIAWMIGIARTQIAEQGARRPHAELERAEAMVGADLEASSLERLMLHDAMRALDDRSRELIALRYGIGLSTREIAADLGLEENAVNVALHRARERLRAIMTNGVPSGAWGGVAAERNQECKNFAPEAVVEIPDQIRIVGGEDGETYRR